MVKNNKINIAEIKNFFLKKNIQVQSIKKFNSDASNKEFTLFDTPHEKYLALSFRNQPKDFKRYINATNALHVLKMPVPPVIYSSRKNVSILMHYISNDNATKYLKTKHLITILQTASNHLIKIRKSKVKFDNIPKKSNDSLIKSATWGVSLYVEHYKKKIDGYDFILNLLTKNLNKTFKKISKYKPVLTHGDFFLDNLIFHHNKVWIIDHQDLAYDHPQLDIASLIYDARRIYSKKIIDKTLNSYLQDVKASQKQNMIDSIHLISLARNLRILGAWVYLHQKGKKNYLKSFKKNTWHQINVHLDYLNLYELKDLLSIIYKETIL